MSGVSVSFARVLRPQVAPRVLRWSSKFFVGMAGDAGPSGADELARRLADDNDDGLVDGPGDGVSSAKFPPPPPKHASIPAHVAAVAGMVLQAPFEYNEELLDLLRKHDPIADKHQRAWYRSIL